MALLPARRERRDRRHAAGHSLVALHDALSGYPDELSPFTAQVEDAGAILAGEPLPALAASDQTFLADLHTKLSATLTAAPLRLRPLHGEVHLGSVLAAAEGPRWIDFEAACTGPLEWDLTGLPNAALEAFPNSMRVCLASSAMCAAAVWRLGAGGARSARPSSGTRRSSTSVGSDVATAKDRFRFRLSAR